MFARPVIFTKFTNTSDGAYLGIPDIAKLKTVLDMKLQEYNESNAMMDLVLFEQVRTDGLRGADTPTDRPTTLDSQPVGLASLPPSLRC